MSKSGEVLEGIISMVFQERGFGFVVHEDKEYWFHKTAVTGDFDSLMPGEKLKFTVLQTGKGLRAVNVERVNGTPARRPKSNKGSDS